MKINDVNLGGGLYRLDVEPTSPCENINNVPIHVMDDIMRDVAKRMKEDKHECHRETRKNWLNDMSINHKFTATSTRDFPKVEEPLGEGIAIKVDKPKRENYGGFDAEFGFNKDMNAYKNLVEAAKKCTWPNCCCNHDTNTKRCVNRENRFGKENRMRELEPMSPVLGLMALASILNWTR